MHYLSKSKYVSFCQCPKIIWLDEYKPELKVITSDMQEVLDNGNKVGDLAMRLFGDFVEVTSYTIDGAIDIPEMVRKTKDELLKKTENICEASFVYNGLYCAVDILHYEDGGYNIYEVKSSTSVKDINLSDVAYQKYVLTNCGVNVQRVYIVVVDNTYVKDGELDVQKFFKINDVTALITKEYLDVATNVEEARNILSNEKEPLRAIGKQCKTPYLCSYKNYCFRNVPKPSVFDLYSIRNPYKYYDAGIVSFDDVIASGIELNKIRQLQVNYYDSDETYIEKEELREFLETFEYPLYYLDFESMNLAIPIYDNTRPYEQVVFQYSLHIKPSPTSLLIHKEFLGDGISNPKRSVAERLCQDISEKGSIIVYNKVFEESRIKEMANEFPDLKDRLLSMNKRIVDLLVPFRNGNIFNKDLCYGFSIKHVLPSFFKNDKELDYTALPVVHNGGEAKNIYPKIKDMDEKERFIVRDGLLKYCKLDTLAMVKIHEKLLELINESDE